jgi:putative endonuclease
MVEGSNKRKTGEIGESVAAIFLERKGYRILGRNYRKPWGEIDLIAEKAGTVRFIEVKTVSRENLDDISRETGHSPEEQVHRFKLEKVARTAELYMDHAKDDRDYQIDVVAVFLDQKTRRARCVLYEQVL